MTTEAQPPVSDDFDFQAYLTDTDFDFDPVDNWKFRLVFDLEEGDARPFGVWISMIVDKDLALILDEGTSFGEYWGFRDLCHFAVDAFLGEFGLELGSVGKALNIYPHFHVTLLVPLLLLGE
jgi:hypothetical protein